MNLSSNLGVHLLWSCNAATTTKTHQFQTPVEIVGETYTWVALKPLRYWKRWATYSFVLDNELTCRSQYHPMRTHLWDTVYSCQWCLHPCLQQWPLPLMTLVGQCQMKLMVTEALHLHPTLHFILPTPRNVWLPQAPKKHKPQNSQGE